MRRRQYLAAASAVATLGLAGCGGGAGGGNNTSGGGGTEAGDTAIGGGDTTAASTETEAATATVTETETEMATETSGGTETTMGNGTTVQETQATTETQTEVMTTSMQSPSPTSAETVSSPTMGTPSNESGMMTTMATSGGGTSGGSNSAATIDSAEFTKQTSGGITNAAMTGEVTATGGRIQNLELQALFRNDAGDVLSTQSIFFQGLAEGQTWLFYVPTLGDAQATTDGEISVASAITGPAPSVSNAEIVESNLTQPSDQFTGPTVTGRAENTGSSPLSYLEARVKFLTSDGAALGSNFTNVSNLPAGETWQFSIEHITYGTDPRPEVADYEVTLAT